jgi:hypothetical protein
MTRTMRPSVRATARRFLGGAARHTAVLVAILGIATGCTRTVEVPREDFDRVRDTGAEYLLVRTVDGHTWRVVEGWATDSTLVVSMTKGPVVADGHYPSPGSSQQMLIQHHPPMEIPFGDICWIDRVETDEVVSGVATVTAGVVAMFFVIVLWSANTGYGG